MFHHQPAMCYIFDVLLDAIKFPDYGFEGIMDGQINVLENWMYNALHNAEQMLPNLEPIKLPDPLPNEKTMNVICYIHPSSSCIL
jgi:hypothetical protein